MEAIHNIMLAAGAIIILLLIRQAMKRFSRKESEFERMHRKIIASEENKVRGRFE